MSEWEDAGFKDIAKARELSRQLGGGPTTISVKGDYYFFEANGVLVAQATKGGPVKQKIQKKRMYRPSKKRLCNHPPNRTLVSSKWSDVDPSRSFESIRVECETHNVFIGEARVLYMKGIRGLISEYREMDGKIQFRTMVEKEELSTATNHLADKRSAPPLSG